MPQCTLTLEYNLKNWKSSKNSLNTLINLRLGEYNLKNWKLTPDSNHPPRWLISLEYNLKNWKVRFSRTSSAFSRLPEYNLKNWKRVIPIHCSMLTWKMWIQSKELKVSDPIISLLKALYNYEYNLKNWKRYCAISNS